jgi:hypothetical protein
MENSWRQRWQEGRIGFHLEETHPALLKYWPTLGVPSGAKVLVPLCGKWDGPVLLCQDEEALHLTCAGH